MSGAGGAEDEGAGALLDGELLNIEDIADEGAEFVELLDGLSGDVKGLLDLSFEALTVFAGVAGEEEGFGVQGDSENMAHAVEDGGGLGVGGVFEVEAEVLVGGGGVEDGLDAKGLGELGDGSLQIALEVEGFGGCVGLDDDGFGEGWALRDPGLGVELGGAGRGGGVLGDDGVLGVQGTGLDEEGLRYRGFALESGFGGLLDEGGEVVFAG